MVDVFISYSRADQDAVRVLAGCVSDLGYDIWWDDTPPPNKSYSEEIADKIGEAKAAIVVWSDSAGKSEWVRVEADAARYQHKLIQAVFAHDVEPPEPFEQSQLISLKGWKGQADHRGWQAVQKSLHELCGPPPDRAEKDRRWAKGAAKDGSRGAGDAPVVRPDPMPPSASYFGGKDGKPVIIQNEETTLFVKLLTIALLVLAFLLALFFW